ncbi:MAG: nucleoside monophosphate kinase [Bacteroidales bacterium]
MEREASKNLLNVVLCGFPGSGKRSHSLLIEEKYGLIPISTGRLIREEIAKGTEIGNVAKPLIEHGENVPDELAIRLIENKIKTSSNAKGFIFKGFPSTFVQAYILDGLLNKIGSSVTCVINFESSSLQCMKRLTHRGKSPEARIYDCDPEIIIHRLEVYEENAPKILEYYEKQDILYNVKDVNDTSTSFQEVCNCIEKGAQKKR